MGGQSGSLDNGRRGSHGASQALVLAVLLLAPGLAAADSTVEAGPVTLIVDDARNGDCVTPVADTCLMEVHSDGTLGGTEVDARQDFRYIGIAVDLPIGARRVGVFDLLPDSGLVIDRDQIYLHYPVARLATELLQNVTSPAPEVVEFTPNETSFSYHRPWPDPSDPQQPVKKSRWGLAWSEEGVGYERIGPITMTRAPHTDTWMAGVFNAACRIDMCERGRAASQSWNDTTPSATAWARFDVAQLATDRDQLGRFSSASAPREGSTEPLPRDGAETAAPRLHTLQPPGAIPLPYERPVSDSATPADAPSTKPDELDSGVRTLAIAPGSTLPVDVWVVVATTTAVAAALAALIGFALYSRITSKPQALQHPMRALILDLVRQSPATSPTELAPLVGLTRNTVVHHVRILRRAGLVRLEQREGRTFLFAAAQSPVAASPEAPQVLCRLAGDDPLLDALLNAPEGMTRAEIHAMLADLPKRTRNHRLRRLLERGILAEEGSGRGARYLVQPDVREHLLQGGKSRS